MSPWILLAALLGSPQVTDAELRSLASQIITDVSSERELSNESTPHIRGMTTDEMRKYVETKIEESDASQLAAAGEVLQTLRLVPEDFDMRASMVSFYSQSAAAVYDPKHKTVYVSNEIPVAFAAPVIAHELTHGLQDQHFDLARYLEAGHDDQVWARHAVVEGGAVFTLKRFGVTLPSARSSASSLPRFVRETLIFPYEAGPSLIKARHAAGGWDAVNELYQSPPKSTEQVMHPDRLDDDPVAISLRALDRQKPKAWTPLHTNVLGEFGIKNLLLDAGLRIDATYAAQGWDGDRYRAYRTGKDGVVFFHRSVWDTEQDAVEFVRAVKRYDAAKALEHATVERRKLEVVWIVPSSDGIKVPQRVLDAVWK